MSGEPLSADEEAAALEVAAGGPGVRILGVESIISERRRGPNDRHAVVLLHERGTGKSAVAAVDLANRTVIAKHETPVQFQLTAEEEREAEELADADEGVTDFLAGRAANPLTRLYFPPGHEQERGHRFAIVFLRPTNEERRYAVVDLTDRRVAHVLGPEHLTGS